MDLRTCAARLFGLTGPFTAHELCGGAGTSRYGSPQQTQGLLICTDWQDTSHRHQESERWSEGGSSSTPPCETSSLYSCGWCEERPKEADRLTKKATVAGHRWPTMRGGCRPPHAPWTVGRPFSLGCRSWQLSSTATVSRGIASFLCERGS